MLALDPDIPLQAQKLSMAAAPGTPANWSWPMDGKPLGRAKDMQWPMWPGSHRLELRDQAGRVAETVRFEVRGAQVKSALGAKVVTPRKPAASPTMQPPGR